MNLTDPSALYLQWRHMANEQSIRAAIIEMAISGQHRGDDHVNNTIKAMYQKARSRGLRNEIINTEELNNSFDISHSGKLWFRRNFLHSLKKRSKMWQNYFVSTNWQWVVPVAAIASFVLVFMVSYHFDPIENDMHQALITNSSVKFEKALKLSILQDANHAQLSFTQQTSDRSEGFLFGNLLVSLKLQQDNAYLYERFSGLLESRFKQSKYFAQLSQITALLAQANTSLAMPQTEKHIAAALQQHAIVYVGYWVEMLSHAAVANDIGLLPLFNQTLSAIEHRLKPYLSEQQMHQVRTHFTMHRAQPKHEADYRYLKTAVSQIAIWLV